MTASEWVRVQTSGLTGRIGRTGQRLGLSPDAVTIAGALIVVGAAPLMAFGAFGLAGLLLIISALFDVLDGAIARAMQRRNRFGALLDSTLDRYTDGLLLLGLIAYFAQRAEMAGLLITGLALVGAYGVSYVRAKAESLGIPCKDGLFSRFERTLILIAALLTGWILPGVIILAIGSNLTAFQRVIVVYRATRADETP
jgi:CDP-diacylglycerol--glycerol-3-phosphate 3-phosphatidyltransferase